ncbi:hypothetical protein [Microbulbifer rhizosphaerae]|uniref:Sulfotransferase family protein n=1 Tax=Microbulbifer rhizosphaerae TaxID=1562603 RepID=A0A7W4WC16_9GAMM|nr:hypothetical protein [Microbulbifer rhizosphaerae]MBB3061485.1 hypothetical protein [Microbulbifer rhizosphaerae]
MKFVVHIGLPRAGSTTLQRQVFPYLQGVHYLGAGASNLKQLQVDSRNFQGLWRAKGEGVREVEQRWRRVINLATEVNPDIDWGLMSYEGWCRPTRMNTLEDIAERIDRVFSRPEILLVVRHPVDWVVSCYKKSLWNSIKNSDGRGGDDLRSFPAYYKSVSSDPARFFGAGGLDPMRLVRVFGADRVRVMPLEYLVATKFEALCALYPDWSLSAFRGARMNASQDDSSLFVARYWHWLPAPLRRATQSWVMGNAARIEQSVGGYLPSVRVQHKLAEQILSVFQSSLDELQSLCGVDLVQLGYTEWRGKEPR